MKRLSLLVLGSALSACGGVVHIRAEAPPPPPVATVAVQADVEPPPPEVTAGDPEEVTATTEPPDPVYEERPAPPSPGYVWVGGNWAWTGSDWAWGPGRWMAPPEGRVYVEPYYERVGSNVVYVRGYWGRPGAPRPNYGGQRLVFAHPVRPANYRPGEPPHIERSRGAPPGSRPPTAYVRTTGTVRPLPHATVPSYRAADRERHPAQDERGGMDRDRAQDRDHAVNDRGRDQVAHDRSADDHDRERIDRDHADRDQADHDHANRNEADRDRVDRDHVARDQDRAKPQPSMAPDRGAPAARVVPHGGGGGPGPSHNPAANERRTPPTAKKK